MKPIFLAFALLLTAVNGALGDIVLTQNIVNSGGVPYDSTLSKGLSSFFSLSLDGLERLNFIQDTDVASIAATNPFTAISLANGQTFSFSTGTVVNAAWKFHLDPDSGFDLANSVRFQLNVSGLGPANYFIVRDGVELAKLGFLDSSLGSWSNTAERGMEVDDTIQFADLGGGILQFQVDTRTSRNTMDEFEFIAITAVPEPGSMVLCAVAGVGFFVVRRRRKS